jgi:hypothetical protein
MGLLGLLILADLVYKGKIKRAETLTRWMHELAETPFHEIGVLPICVMGLSAGLLLFVLSLIFDGFSSWALLLIPLPVFLLLVGQVAYAKESQDPHRDIPLEVRGKTDEEVRKHKERLRDLNEVRILRGEQQGDSDIPQRVAKLKKLKQQEAELLKQDPDMEEEIARLTEMDRTRELEKHK